MAYTVFLSHSGSDLSLVRAIQSAAVSTGMQVYAFEDDLMPGADLPEKLRQRVRQSQAVVALLTAEGAASPAVNQEIGMAVEANKLVIPIIEDRVDPSRITMLQGLEYLVLDRTDPHRTVQQLMPRLLGLKEKHESGQALGMLLLAGLAVWALGQG